MKKLVISLLIICSLVLAQSQVFAAKASYETQLKKGNQQFKEQQYTSAIEYFSKAVQLQSLGTEARIGLANSYIARADKYMNKDKEWGKAANDYRSALFYLQYYEPKLNNSVVDKLILDTEDKLNNCLKKLHARKNSDGRYDVAELLMIAENYSAAGYEYNQASKDKNYTKKCTKKLQEVSQKLNK